MKSRLTLAFLFLFLVSLGCAYRGEAAEEPGQKDTAAASAAEPGTPLLIVPESTFDFGEVREEKEYVHAFIIKNVGTGVLEIKKVVPG